VIENADLQKRHLWRGHLFKHLFPALPNVISLLVTQGEITMTALEAFRVWSHGADAKSADELREAYHNAYKARRELLSALQTALSTPVDQEDIYILSERVDHILVEAKNLVREAEVLGWKPDSFASSMADRLASGTKDVVEGLKGLGKSGKDAGIQADAASEAVHHVERDYREAMAGLVTREDIRQVIASQDLYRRYLSVSEAIMSVVDRLWYAVLRGA
jgi:uncharacterized protein Yka (UPF0111/DUF47 family)